MNLNVKNSEQLNTYIQMFGFDLGVVHWFAEIKKQDFPILSKSIEKSKSASSANEIKLLRTKDGYTEKEIALAINSSFNHDFWKKQIFSLAQIRSKCKDGLTKFEHLLLITKELQPEKNDGADYEILN